jgi:hypothetical protein
MTASAASALLDLNPALALARRAELGRELPEFGALVA